MSHIDIYEIRSRYTNPDNVCKSDIIDRMAAIAIAHDVASLVGEIEDLRSQVAKLRAEVLADEVYPQGKEKIAASDATILDAISDVIRSVESREWRRRNRHKFI